MRIGRAAAQAEVAVVHVGGVAAASETGRDVELVAVERDDPFVCNAPMQHLHDRGPQRLERRRG